MLFTKDDRVRLKFEPSRHGTITEVHDKDSVYANLGGGYGVDWDKDKQHSGGIYLEDELEGI